MAEDIEDYLDCLSGDLKAQAQVLVDALNNDKNQAQKARLEARMATTQARQKYIQFNPSASLCQTQPIYKESYSQNVYCSSD